MFGAEMEDESWGEFCNTFGASPKNRVIEFFLEAEGLDFGIGDVAEETGLNRATAYNVMAELVEEKIIVSTRILGRTQLYKLNLGNPKVEALREVFKLLLERIAQEHTVGEELLAH